MGKGYHETADCTGNAHCTSYNDEGRHSWDEDSQGNVTGDHVTYNDDPDNHINGEDYNLADVDHTPESQADDDNGPK